MGERLKGLFRKKAIGLQGDKAISSLRKNKFPSLEKLQKSC